MCCPAPAIKSVCSNCGHVVQHFCLQEYLNSTSARSSCITKSPQPDMQSANSAGAAGTSASSLQLDFE